MNLHNFKRFLQESTVHGVRYFIEGENALHKFVWMVIMGSSVGFMLFMIIGAASLWKTDPSTNTIDRVELQELDFPAVTVCADWPSDSLALQTIYNMIDVKGKVMEMVPETMSSIIWQNYLQTEGNKIGWMMDDSVNSFVNIALRKTDLESFMFSQEGNIWNNIILKVDQVYMESCLGSSSVEMLKFCDFNKLVLSKKAEVEKEAWFAEWQQINTRVQTIPDYFSFIDQMVRIELVNVFWDFVGKSGFVPHMLDFLATADFGRLVQESEEYVAWKTGGGTVILEGAPSGPADSGTPQITVGQIIDNAAEFADIVLTNLGKMSQTVEAGNFNKLLCVTTKRMHNIIFSLKDGIVFSPSIVKNHVELGEALTVLKDASTADLKACMAQDNRLFLYFPAMRALALELEAWVQLKRYEDGFNILATSDCIRVEQKEECACECDKQNKVKVHKMFRMLSLLDTSNVENLGSVLEWFMNSHLKDIWGMTNVEFRDGTWGKTRNKTIGGEVVRLDREVLTDITGVDSGIGLRDMVASLSLPARIWADPLWFPALESWDKEARNEIMSFFNYIRDQRVVIWRGIQNMNTTNLLPFLAKEGVTNVCQEPVRGRFPAYCKIVESLPPLDRVMQLMQLASNPMELKSDTRAALGLDSFPASDIPLPRTSFIPQCFYEKDAANYWNIPDYNEILFYSEKNEKDYEQMLQAGYGIPPSDIYKYPKCQHFRQAPTDSGICHTFNGLPLKTLLKPSEWLDSFNGVFRRDSEVEMEGVLQSVGIDKENGFVFAVDTMKAFEITKFPQNVFNPDIQDKHNKFWLKVHKAGDLPVMQEDKSTWTKIEGTVNDMVTKLITIKGEKYDAKEAFRDIDIEYRKCLFHDEGELELFSYYTASNCRLECAWKVAESTCACRPWFVPSRDSGTQMCFAVGSSCFQQVMDNIRDKKQTTDCDCKKDCIGSRYSLRVDNLEVFERLSYKEMVHPVFFDKTKVLLHTLEKEGRSKVKDAGWYNLGEYLVDKNFSLLPHDPFLDMTFPRPLTLKGACGSGWTSDSSEECQPVTYGFNGRNTEEILNDRQKNIFKVALYYEADQGVITKITKDAKMTWSDKISWIGGNMGLFTGFSLISGFEFLYWMVFKVVFHMKDTDGSSTSEGSGSTLSQLEKNVEEQKLLLIRWFQVTFNMKDTKVSPISETTSVDGCSIVDSENRKIGKSENAVEDAEDLLTSEDVGHASLSKLEETVKEQKLETENQKIKVEEMRASIRSLERTVGLLASGGDQDKAGIIFDAVFQTNMVTKPSANSQNTNTKEDSNLVAKSPEKTKINVMNESPAKANSNIVTKTPAKNNTDLMTKTPAKTNPVLVPKSPANTDSTSLDTKSPATHVVTVEPK